MTHRLYALSDLHINYPVNRAAVQALPAHSGDGLVLAGDIADTAEQLDEALAVLTDRFEQVWWVPGNHELWSRSPGDLRGAARYDALVALCQRRGVATPECPWHTWPHPDCAVTVAPAFVGYDFSFASAGRSPAEVRRWAAAGGIVAADDRLLHADPHPSVQAWCAHRVALTEARLEAHALTAPPLVFVGHYPLLEELVRFPPRVQRYTPWCGTTATRDWHRRFPIAVAVSGHLHMRATDWRDGVRFEEVAVGYPRHWQTHRGLAAYLRPIWPGPPPPRSGHAGPTWHR